MNIDAVSSQPSVIAFEPHRFKTSAEYYLRGRLDYPTQLIESVLPLVGLSRHHRVLDLGCGPGLLAVAFAPHASEVVGIDPEPAMLEQAVAYAAQRRVQVKFVQGSSYELGQHLGRFQLVTMGRSFHWMDRAATLDALAHIVAEDGALALFGDSHLEVPANGWKKRFQSIIDPFAEKDPGSRTHRRNNPSWLPHEAVLLDSKFCHLQRISVVQKIATPVERLLERALSMSSTSPQRLGAEQERMVASLRAALNEEARDGVIGEVVESEALLAFRHAHRAYE
jgi:SAM-dependent methyltransferase